MARTMKITICHLYPDLMDTYGDKGNILALKYRSEKRGVDTSVEGISLNQKLEKNKYDLFFFGGGQDRQQIIVSKDLKTKAKVLKKEIENGKVLLSVCGGYQLLLEYFQTVDGQKLDGIGLFRGHTLGSNRRMIGNLLIKLNPELHSAISSIYPTTHLPNYPTNYLIGFENHSGKTFVKNQTIGQVVSGWGNNGDDGYEGAWYKNAFGCYLHGSLLPKNPHLADYLISVALRNKYGDVKLKPLDDSIEWNAHRAAVSITKIKK